MDVEDLKCLYVLHLKREILVAHEHLRRLVESLQDVSPVKCGDEWIVDDSGDEPVVRVKFWTEDNDE